MESDLSGREVRNFKEGREHTIRDILTREYLILHTTIPIGGEPGEELYLIDPIEKLLSQPNVHDKVNGFAFLRTFLNVRFEFTVAPKTSGGLIIAFFADMSATAITNRTKKLIQISQTPHIKVSLTTSQSIEQKVPWVSAFLSRNLQSGSGRPGKIYIGRLTPLDIGTVKMNVYVSADPETLELEFPTIGAPLQDEAFLRQKVAKANQELRDMVSRNTRLHPIVEHSKVAVAGRTPRILPRKDVGTVREANNMAQGGIVSAVLREGAKIATAASGLPMVGSTAASVAPLLSAGANTASAMGYSKPTMDTPVVAVKWKPGDGQLSAQTSINSHIYTIDQGNSVATNYPLFGSELDEMSVDYIMKTPNILDNHIFKITDDQVTNQVLAVFPLTINPIVEHDGLLYLSHQAWASSTCQNWNAELHFQLDVFCTMFHNVKLRAIIAPNDHSTYAVGDIIDLEKINKAMSTVMQFTGPKANQTFTAGVMSNSAMKYVASPFIVDGTGSGYEYLVAKQKTEFCSYGTAYITTEVPLEVTADASHTIYCVPSFYATKVELSNPSTLINYLPAKHVGGAGLITGFENTSRSQVQTRGSPISTGPSLPQAGTRNLEISMGDQFTHLSKLLMAYLSFNNTNVLNATKAIVVNPYQFRALEDSEYIDLVDYFAAGFGFYTGLMQMRLLTHEKQGYVGDSFIMSSFANQYFKNNSPTGYKIIEDAAYLNPGVRCIQHFAQEGVIDAKIPFYQPFHIARTSHSETFSSWFEGQLPVHWYFKSTTDQKVRLYRAIHEDFKFGFLTGLPPFKINPNAIIHA
nr:MAG: capsid protein [Picornaviridae sp.]